jgi:hypothetical protein
MDKPLTVWYCDLCGKRIEDAKNGVVVWNRDKDNDSNCYDFKIIHHNKCGQQPPNTSWLYLTDFIGHDGLGNLLSHLSCGPVLISKKPDNKNYCDISDFDGYVEFFRRVQVPYYEEARRLFNADNIPEELQDLIAEWNEIEPYKQANLKMSSKYTSVKLNNDKYFSVYCYMGE